MAKEIATLMSIVTGAPGVRGKKSSVGTFRICPTAMDRNGRGRKVCPTASARKTIDAWSSVTPSSGNETPKLAGNTIRISSPGSIAASSSQTRLSCVICSQASSHAKPLSLLRSGMSSSAGKSPVNGCQLHVELNSAAGRP
eukprot:3064891-Rhodomonas_salina.1